MIQIFESLSDKTLFGNDTKLGFMKQIASYTSFSLSAGEAEKNEEDSKDKKDEPSKLGTLMGVYLPCVQNIFGVILFIRMPWIVGLAGESSMISDRKIKTFRYLGGSRLDLLLLPDNNPDCYFNECDCDQRPSASWRKLLHDFTIAWARLGRRRRNDVLLWNHHRCCYVYHR